MPEPQPNEQPIEAYGGKKFSELSTEQMREYLQSKEAAGVDFDAPAPVEAFVVPTAPEETVETPPAIQETAPPVDPIAQQATPPVETPPAEPAPDATTPPVEESPFLKANEQTVYLNSEEAIRGINEKDLTIERLKRELDMAKQQEASFRARFGQLEKQGDAEFRQEQQVGQVPPSGEAPAPAAQPAAPDIPPLTDDEFWEVYEGEGEGQGPVHAVKEVVSRELGQYQKDIELIRRLNDLDVTNMLAALRQLDIPGWVLNRQVAEVKGHIDQRFPDFAGKWYPENSEQEALAQEFNERWNEMDQLYNIQTAVQGNPEKLEKTIGLILEDMAFAHGITPAGQAGNPQTTAGVPNSNTQGIPQRTTAAAPAPDTGQQVPASQAELDQHIRSQIDLALEAHEEQARLHGGSLTETPGAKSHAAPQKTGWTPAEIRADPSGYREWAKVHRGGVPLDALPPTRS